MSISPLRASIVTLLVLAAFGSGTAHALAASSITIQEVNPVGGATAGQQMTFIVSASGFTNPAYSLTDDFSGSSVTSSDISNVGYFSWTPLIDDAGTHHITLTVSDAYGDTGSTTALLYVIPDTISIQNLSPGTQAYTREPVTFTIHTPGFTSPWFSVYDTYPGSTVSTADITPSTGAFSWSPAVNEQGLHSITIGAYDGPGHSAKVVQNITVSPPSIATGSLTSGTFVPVGAPVSFTATTVGLTNPVFAVADSLGKYSSVNAGDFSTTTAGLFSWTPLASDIGAHVLTISGTDSYNSTASTKLTLDVVAASAEQSAGAATTATSSATNAGVTSGGAGSAVQQDGYIFTRYLNIGASGAGVVELQKHLALDGFFSGTATGYFGTLTQAAVERFQSAHGIVSSGTPSSTGYGALGPRTRAALNAE